MNEEIDIIELLQREKEGKMPKRIEINGKVYIHTLYQFSLGVMYVEENNMSAYWKLNNYMIDTKIKILDKPIIGRLEVVDLTNIENTIINIGQKLNEIIDYINQNNKE